MSLSSPELTRSNSSSRPSFLLTRSISKSALSISSKADEMTRYTAIDSFACKASVSAVNYPALSKNHSLFVSLMRGRLEKTGRKFVKRSPIMHRGYYARMEGQQMAIERFLSLTNGDTQHKQRQILYLGCGFDTAPVANYAHHKENDKTRAVPLRIFEVDFADVINLKHEIYSTEPKIVRALQIENALDNAAADEASALPHGATSILASESIAEESEEDIEEEEKDSNREKRRAPLMGTVVEEKEGDALDEDKSARYSPQLNEEKNAHPKDNEDSKDGMYHSFYSIGALSLIAQDIRNTDVLIDALQCAGFDATCPTLIITECVLVYLSQEETQDLVLAMGQFLSAAPTVWISYDMISPHDTYGEMMSKNLDKAGFVLPGFEAFPTLESHENKFLHPFPAEDAKDGTISGWKIARSIDMLSFYNRVIPQSILDKIHRLELLDEIEEWNLIMSHYCLTVSANDSAMEQIVSDLTNMRSLSGPSPVKFVVSRSY